MKKIRFSRALMLLFTFIAFHFISSGFTTKFGLDSYEIYLNNKLVTKQYVNQPLNLRVLRLDQAKENDLLQVAYTHCINKGVGTGRSITLKNEQGDTLHQWTFAESELKMTLAVKDLLQQQKRNANHELGLYYSANELPKGEMISMVRFK
jgi:hypothetical protein